VVSRGNPVREQHEEEVLPQAGRAVPGRGHHCADQMVDDPLPNGNSDGEDDEFFAEKSDHSKVKTAIATKYFFAWAEIISPKARSNRMAYVDLYAGPGRYMDGTKSTPLLILEHAIANPHMRDTLVTYFNDAKPAHADSLETAINALPGIGTLKYQPAIDKDKVGPATVDTFGKPHIPTFAFIDPYGYKGLSLGLVNAVIKDWACECLFFFNYNRINPGINNQRVAPHMEGLFGAPRLAALQADVKDRAPAEREMLVLAALTHALEDLGGRFIVPFRFKMDEARSNEPLPHVREQELPRLRDHAWRDGEGEFLRYRRRAVVRVQPGTTDIPFRRAQLGGTGRQADLRPCRHGDDRGGGVRAAQPRQALREAKLQGGLDSARKGRSGLCESPGC